jgi:hypothetical protein
MAKTLRPKNVCNDCGNTWYPKGKDLSSVCPRCKNGNVRISREGLIGPALIAFFLIYSGIADFFKKPDESVQSPTETVSSSITNNGSNDLDISIEKSKTLEEHINSTPESIGIDHSAVDTAPIPESNVYPLHNEVFQRWNESELMLRDTYTRFLNDSTQTAPDLEERKKGYLAFAETKNKKCGDLNSNIVSNINSNVSNINFAESDIASLRCHLEENLLEITKVNQRP